jgi:hypothetical protein
MTSAPPPLPLGAQLAHPRESPSGPLRVEAHIPEDVPFAALAAASLHERGGLMQPVRIR